MRVVRRRLASGALALIALQLTLLFAVPVSACCASSAAARATSIASDDAPDCCPPGAHPKGECPLHGGRRSDVGGRKTTHCRLTCGHTSLRAFVLGAIGVLPPPAAALVPFAESAAVVAASANVPLRSSSPDAPPPRLL